MTVEDAGARPLAGRLGVDPGAGRARAVVLRVLGRVAKAVVTLVGVAVVVFIVLRLLPGNQITSSLGVNAGLLTNADQNPSSSTRASLYDQISTYLTNNAVWIWLFDSYDYTVLASSVHGYAPLPNEQLSALATTTVSG